MNLTCRISGARGRGLCAVLAALSWPVVGALAEATIVYRDIGDVPIFTLSGSVCYDLDLDHDGTHDITFRATGGQFDCVARNENRILSIPAAPPDLGSDVIPLIVAEEVSSTPGDPYAWSPSLMLPSGIKIGSVFTSCMAVYNGVVCLGLFTGRNAHMGVEFHIDGEVHYGWVRVDCSLAGINGGWVTEYAYETRPGVPIKAGAKPVVVPTAAPEVARPGYLRLKWSSGVSKAYQVQSKTRLDALRWTDLDFVIPATSSETMVDLPMEGAAQFLRVIEAD
ncbi:MAG: hypothetical protein Q8Q12_11020 [bacterium]|nr:hypothetical protein [bacterium]